MTVLEIVMAIAGASVTAMVVVGMILLTPSGAESMPADSEQTGADPGSPDVPAPQPARGVPAAGGSGRIGA